MSDDTIDGVFDGEAGKVVEADTSEPAGQPAATDAPAPETKPAPRKPRGKKAGASAARSSENTENTENTEEAEEAEEAEVERVDIILQKNPDIPPSGLFLGHNGVGYQLKPGKKARVPVFLLDILDNAVTKLPIVDDLGRVVGYEDSLRFSYQVVRGSK